MAKLARLLTSLRQVVQEILAVTVSPRTGLRRLRTVVHFFILLWRGFENNRCPVRAAALSYTTLLALVPVLAIALSFSKNFLHEAATGVVPQLMDRMITVVAPELEVTPESRANAVAQIQSFINNINAGTLGTVGTIFLFVIGIRLMMTVELAFNDIWGIQRGRSLLRKIVYYWTTITMGPVLVVLAAYCAGRAEFSMVVGKLHAVPELERMFWQFLPMVVIWVAFALLYALMPNTRVHPFAALVGGILAGTLWQANNMLGTLYVARIVSYSRIYGALGVLPVLLVGLYFSWLIVLFGAQVSYAVQNVHGYLQQRAGELIDQRGRELLACRTVWVVCERFAKQQPPPTVGEIAEQIQAPAQWLNRVVHRLAEGGLVTRTGEEGGLVPARLPDTITLADVLQVVRTGAQAAKFSGHESMEKLLADLHVAERNTASNRSFGDLVRSEK